jgi:hypothetical protein
VRCTRCREHEAELEIALEELRSAFADTAPVEAPAEKPAVKKPRAQLRVVPAPPLLPAAPEPPAIEEPAAVEELPPVEEPAAIEAPAALEPLPPPDEPVPFPAPPPAPPLPVPLPPAAMARHQRIRAALPVAVAVLIAVGLIAAAIALLSRIGDDPGARAPWDAPNAPLVHPPPLNDQ